jgi:hypothetical protein
MAGDLKVIYAARTMQEAYLLRNVLEEEGVRAIVTNAVLEGGAGTDILGWPTLARVAVNEENAVAARQIALEFDRTVRTRAEASSDVAAAEGGPGERPDAAVAPEALAESWPRCPQCGAPRITKCPACGTSGTGFPQADPPEAPQAEEASPGALVLCLECDEPFTPEYAGQCEWCGHKFPDGFAPAADQAFDLSPGLLAVVGIALAIVVGLLVYFAILLGRSGTG